MQVSLGKAKKEDITPKDDASSMEKSKDKGKGKEVVSEGDAQAEEASATRHRRTRREI